MKTILVVEDEKPLQNVIQNKLKIEGFEVLTAREVSQAIEYLKEVDHIDGIWLDHYLLGSGNGLDLVVEVKGNEKWKKIPIFVVSNTASPDKVDSYLKLGVERYFTKANFRLDEIISDINKTLKEGA